ncbi:MAG: RHS repeat domain-containing protein, partial [Blastococcus sp.]
MRPATAPAGTTGTAPKLLAASSTATSSVGAGSFATTSLSPASGWQGGLSGGAFTWSYPMRVPPAAAGPEPAVSLSYDSHAVDGETGSTNNQPVAVGDGWRLNGSGFIERSYVPCSLDPGASGPVPTSGDRCWSTDNATLDLAGRTVLLVKDRLSGTWRLQDDDGSRLEHLTGAVNGARGGEYWRLTTTDGTQYDFGLNQLPGWSTGKATTNSAWTVPVYGNDPGEPCHASTFATSSCTQAWRWNLDYVVDPHGNAEALYYSPETNRYAQNGSGGTSYVRGGQLDHIDYGLSSTTVYAANAASDKVLFTYANRCASTTNCDSAHPTTWPDVPWALNCAAAPCGQVQPTFWSTRMLSTVTTQVWSGSAYSAVDTWALRHSFPTPGDGTSPALWLNAIGHTGSAGGSPVTLPEVVFSGMAMQNRVNATTGLVNLDRYRITSLRTETGAIVSVNYAGPDCTADGAGSIGARANTNARRCFPQLWVPQAVPPQPARADVFHTYLVTSVIQDPHTGGTDDAAVETYYVYTGAPGWRYDTFPGTPAAQRTWSTFAGVSALEVRVGSPSSPTTQQTTAYTFFRGMDRDRAASWGGAKSVTVTASDGSTVPDSRWLAGRTREVRTRNGVGGAVLSDVLATPWASRPMATDDRLSARMVGDGDVVTTAPLAAGGTRRTETRTDYDTYGRPVQVADLRSDAASTCTTTSYATNTAAWLLAYPSEKRTVGRDCATTPSYPADAVSDVRTVYDGGSVGSAPTQGDATTTQTVAAYTGSTPVWQTTAVTAYDGMGRVTSVTDPRAGLDRTTTTAYTPATRGPLTQQAVTNPLGWTTTTASDPAWGLPTSVTDANGHTTTTTYDALGRRTAVWAPDRPQAANASTPNVAYAYTVSTTSPLAVATTTLRVNSLVTSWELFDGLGRPRQTQRSGEIGATVITDNYYDDAGRMRQRNQDYYTFQVQPSATLFVPFSTVSGQETLDYDAAGRILADAQWFNGTQAWQTGYAYPGVDRVDRTPPAGGTPTTTFTNSLGERTRLVQYLASAPGASAQQEATSYRYDARGDLTGTTDPAGNVSSWGFDVLGRQVSATTPDTGTSTTAYDDA